MVRSKYCLKTIKIVRSGPDLKVSAPPLGLGGETTNSYDAFLPYS